MLEPDSGVAVGLQFQPHSRRPWPGALPAALHPSHSAGQVLDVMAALVGEDVRLGCVAALRAELAGQLIKEIKIEVHSGVGWAIEGPDCRSCMSTRCIDAAGEGLNLDFLIALPCVFPVVLDRVRVCDEPAIAVGGDI